MSDADRAERLKVQHARKISHAQLTKQNR
jgi:hypothetical protein